MAASGTSRRSAYSRRGGAWALISLGTVAAAMLLQTSAARAVCAPPAVGAGDPPPTSVVTCSGATVNQNTPDGYGTGGTDQAELTIIIEALASVTGTNNGFNLGADNIIVNSGAITGTAAAGVNTTGAVTVSNVDPAATITGSTFGVASTGTVIVDNAGMITSTAGTAISAVTAIVINTGTIQGQGATGDGIVATSAGVDNAGTISGVRYGINTTDVILTNNNTITGGTAGINASGVVAITNLGTISGSQGIIATGGTSVVTNSGTITGSSGNAINFGAGNDNTLVLTGTSVINGTVTGTGTNNLLQLGGTVAGTFNVSNIGAGQQYQGFSLFEKIGSSTWTLTGSGAQNWTITEGTLIGDTTSIQGGLITNNAALVFNQAFDGTYAGAVSGTGSLTKQGAGIVTLTGTNSYTGDTVIDGGTLRAGAVNVISNLSAVTVATGATFDLNSFNQTIASLAGAGNVMLGAATLTTGGNDASTVLSGGISGTGGLTKIGAGTFTLSGTNAYSGDTNVSAGTLFVSSTGSIANSLTFVNSGATLAGDGTVGAVAVNNGGTLAPGPPGTPGTMTIAGNLAFQSGALYLVQVNPSNASIANVTAGGTATLAGTVQAQFAAGSYITRNYTILTSAGLGGTTFGSLTTGNLPAGFTASLSYTSTDVILNLTATLGAVATGGLSGNQQNVASALNNFFNNGGALPPNFVAVFGLAGGDLANALTLLSGEAATGAQQGALQLMSQFLGVMLDPFVDGRGGGVWGPAIGFAPERPQMPDDIALAYAKVMKAPIYKAPPSFEQRWNVWGSAYGGYNRTSGDPAVVGSQDLTARAAGFAAGLDYRVAPGTVVGFALAGAGTNWSLAQGLGGGRSDALQAGVYAATHSGPAYVAAALAYTHHWMSTDRFAFAGDHLTADFNAQSFGGRIEGGYRVATPAGAMTPYAAVQAQSFRTPAYTETDVNGGGFGLSYDARTGTATRSELGARFDNQVRLEANAVLALRGRLAWAHDWITDPSLAAAFQALPGASFIVNGATPAKDSALVSAGSELRLANGVTLSGKFDGEFANRSSTYAGTGTVRVAW